MSLLLKPYECPICGSKIYGPPECKKCGWIDLDWKKYKDEAFQAFNKNRPLRKTASVKK